MTDEDQADEEWQLKARVYLLENFFDALGSKKNRDILSYLLEEGPKKVHEILMKVAVRGNQINRRLNALNKAALIIQGPDRRISATPFAEMALAAIGIALERVELVQSK